MTAPATLNLSGQRLRLILDDDDLKVVTFWVPFDPSGDTWACLVRPRAASGELVEWNVTTSGTSSERGGIDKWPVMVDADTANFGESDQVYGLFRDTGSGLLPFITGTLTTLAVVQQEVGS